MNKRLVATLSIVVALVLLLFLTRPNKTDHAEAISETLSAAFENAAATNTIMQDADRFGLQGLVGYGLKKGLENELNYHDYLLFTTTHIMIGHKKQFVGVGVFGHVFTAKEENIQKYIENFDWLP
ncbi:MAG: DUF4359 domain-containing protein [Alloprevotella sp.]|nr:DUF4359 domain-containing protein [Alloprevotella sp.]